MAPEPRSIHPQIIRAALTGPEADRLDDAGGYVIRETEAGLKVRRNGRQVADVADLDEGLRVILADMAASVRLVVEATPDGRLWEAMLLRNDTD